MNVSWFITLAFVTSMLALRFYPAVFPVDSPHRHDRLLHWLMAAASGLAFFASIVLHELAHSLVAQKQGVPVKGITLFIFGGVAQIAAESRRPLHEFIMAVVGPLTSVALGGIFFLLWWLVGGFSEREPVPLVLEWLFLMNLVVGAFNLAPGFPMDGGRLARAALWGLTGDYQRATRWATRGGRAMGYGLMGLGLIAGTGVFHFVDPLSGLWFFVLGLFLEQSARQSWFQAQAIEALGRYSAGDIMVSDMETIGRLERVRALSERGGKQRRRFIFFVSDEDENVLGVLTEKEVTALRPERRVFATAEEAMLATERTPVATPADSGARLLQAMEAADVWHLPVVSEGRVIGVVSKESLLRLLGQRFSRPSLARQA